MKAPTNSGQNPKPFMFRPPQAGESKAEYQTLMARAKEKFQRGRKAGKAKAIKGLLQGKTVSTHVDPEDPPGGADEMVDE